MNFVLAHQLLNLHVGIVVKKPQRDHEMGWLKSSLDRLNVPKLFEEEWEIFGFLVLLKLEILGSFKSFKCLGG